VIGTVVSGQRETNPSGADKHTGWRGWWQRRKVGLVGGSEEAGTVEKWWLLPGSHCQLTKLYVEEKKGIGE